MTRPLRGSERRAALLVGDAFAVTAAVLLSLWTWSITAGFPFDASFVWDHAVWLLAVPLWVVALVPTRESRTVLDTALTMRGIVRVAGALLLVYLAAFFWLGGERLPRLMALYVLWNSTLLVFAGRVVAHWSFTRALFSRRILVVGAGRPLVSALRVLEDPSFRDAEIVGVVTTEVRTAGGPPVLGSPADVDEVAQRFAATDVVVAIDGRVSSFEDRFVQRLLRCQERGAVVTRLAELYEDRLRRVPVEHLEPSWLLTNFFDVARSRDASPLAKRVFDIAAAATLAVVGLFIGPIIALAILLDSGRPVFYRQERLGRGGRPFTMTKFRTMRQNAEEDGRARWSVPADPRVTRVGRWLRRTRLDELPNVMAVVRGTMSMVGPRPERSHFVEELERQVPLYRARLTVAPGLTGWAQINTGYGASVNDAIEKLEYDLYYIKHRSLSFDALILLRTAATIFRFGGR